jgi:hypothetical protein
MSTTNDSEIGMRALQKLLREAIDGQTRRAVAERASEVALRMWREEAPLIDDTAVRDLDTRLVTPPGDGRILRCVLSATGIPLVEALETLGYWPDPTLGPGASAATRVVAAMRLSGFPHAKLITVNGRRVVVEI